MAEHALCQFCDDLCLCSLCLVSCAAAHAELLEGVRELTLTETGWVFSAGALGNSLLALGIGRLNPRRGFLLAQLLVTFFAALMWLGMGLPVFMLAYFLLGGFRAARPMAMAQARDLVHELQMGITYGTMETVSAIIFIIAPPIAGFIFERDPFIVIEFQLV